MDVRVKAFGAAAGVVLLDRLTKWIVETNVSFRDTLQVIPGFFDIVHAENKMIVRKDGIGTPYEVDVFE